jgi:DNA-binding NarL/FixJ family response regulator
VIRLIITDDYPEIRDMLATYFSEFTDEFEVIGVAGNGQEALDLVRLRRPDAVLTDIVMPVMDGIAATRAITDEFPGVTVITYTSHTDPKLCNLALGAGAAHHIFKPFDFVSLREDVRKCVRERRTSGEKD